MGNDITPETIRQLRIYQIGLAILTFGLAVVRLLQYVSAGETSSLFNALMLFGLSGVVMFAWWGMQRANPLRSILLTAGVLMGIAPIIVFVRPYYFATLFLCPFIGIFLILPFINSNTLRQWLIAGIVIQVFMNGVYILGDLARIQGSSLERIFSIFVLFVGSGITMFMLWGFHNRLNRLLRESRKANNELEAIRDSLETQVAERTAALKTALTDVEQRAREHERMNEELQAQRQTIRELSMPVLPISNDTLVIPLIGELDSRRLEDLQQVSLSEIQRRRVRRVLLDITGVPMVDSQVAQGILVVVQGATLLGAEVALIGVRPEVAETIVSLGITLRSVRIYRDLQSAIRVFLNQPAAHVLEPGLSA